jgi:hypothetical protein
MEGSTTMAGRPRLYANAAEKTRAYRERIKEQDRGTMKVNSQWFEQNQADARRLIIAVWAAQRRKDPLALSLRTKKTADLMADLARFFETGEITLAQAPPAKKSKGGEA